MRKMRLGHTSIKPLFPAALLLTALATGGFLAIEAQQAPTQASPALVTRITPEARFTAEDLGDSMLVKKRYQKAIEAYKNASQSSALVWNKMGIAYQMMYDMKNAARCYRESLRRNPGNAWALNNLGTVYQSAGDLPQAEKLFRKGFELDPNAARIAMNLGTVLMAQNKFSEGSDFYKRALALAPDVFDEADLPHFKSGVPVAQRGAMNYYKAKACAQAAKNECALQFLEKSLNQGFTDPDKIALDWSFAHLRGNPDFERLMARQSQP